jgi:hypothetical protein
MFVWLITFRSGQNVQKGECCGYARTYPAFNSCCTKVLFTLQFLDSAMLWMKLTWSLLDQGQNRNLYPVLWVDTGWIIIASSCPNLSEDKLYRNNEIAYLLYHISAAGSYLILVGRSMAQAISRWLPTAAARVQARFWSSGICGGQSGDGAGFLRVLRIPLSIFIPPNTPSS